MPTSQNGTYVNNGAAVEQMAHDHLTPAERKRLTQEAQGTPFDPFERLFASYDGGTAFAYSDFEAADYREMLRRDGQARKLEQVLTLPIRAANWRITPDEGDQGQAEFVEKALADKLNLIIDQMTSACTYRRAFFETSWTLDADGRLVYEAVEMRPATGCEPGFNPKNGRPKGFRQRVVPIAGVWPTGTGIGGNDKYDPGWATIKPNRAFIYVHGIHRDPINGLSDLDAAQWCHTTKQKVMFLWFQYLEAQALPKTVVYGDDDTQATERATRFRELRSSGVMGIERPGDPNAKTFELLETSGKGASDFATAISYLDSMMSTSVLASYTDLAMNTGGSIGSYALSADQSEFFLESRQAVADEMADAIRRDLFGPLVAFNFGVTASVPKIEIGPISKKQGENALNMLQAIVTAVNLNVPREFVDQLTLLCSEQLGMSPKEVKDAIEKDAQRREVQNELQDEVNRAQAAQTVAEADQVVNAPMTAQSDPSSPGALSTGSPSQYGAPGSGPTGIAASNLAGAVDTLFDLATNKGGDS